MSDEENEGELEGRAYSWLHNGWVGTRCPGSGDTMTSPCLKGPQPYQWNSCVWGKFGKEAVKNMICQSLEFSPLANFYVSDLNSFQSSKDWWRPMDAQETNNGWKHMKDLPETA